jgi:hypothetical protein
MSNHPNRSRKPRTINGQRILRTRIFASAEFWRWKIVTVDGREYLDGGNYLRRSDAEAGLAAALDR